MLVIEVRKIMTKRLWRGLEQNAKVSTGFAYGDCVSLQLSCRVHDVAFNWVYG